MVQDIQLSQKNFIKILYDCNVPREHAVRVVKKALKKNIIPKRCTTELDDSKLARRVVSQYYYRYREEEKKNGTYGEYKKVIFLETPEDVIKKHVSDNSIEIRDSSIDIDDDKVENVIIEVDEDEIELESDNQDKDIEVDEDKIEKKDFWDL